MTDAQRDFITALRHQTHCPDYALDNWCIWNYGCRLAALDIRQASALIDEMKEWKVLPARLQRAMGQQELPGMEERS